MEYHQEGDYIAEYNHEKAVVRIVSTGKVIKRFKGELAWNKAETLVSELAFDPNRWI